MIVTTDAIVLKTMKYRDTSQIVTLFSRDHGKLSVVAKGIRNSQKGGAGGLDPMSCVRAVVYKKPGKELHLMSQCDRLRVFKGLADDLKRIAGGMAAVELTNLAMPVEEPHTDVFTLLEKTLESLGNATRSAENALYYYEVQLLGILGFRPELKSCLECGRSLTSIAETGIRRCSISTYGLVCSGCEDRGYGGQEISLAAVSALAGLQDTLDPEGASRIVLSPALRDEIGGALRHLVMHHLTGMKPLQSEQVFSMLE
jgi:DNA repair protein RecO (recombination protein O)